MNQVAKYFPGLSGKQHAQFEKLPSLYSEWNAKINVVSRKDIPCLDERHVLHSLAIAKFICFKEGSKILDVGTGGGFPGIPLAIFFPQVSFLLIDSIGKKIKVVQSVADQLELANVSCMQIRAEDLRCKIDFVISRAVAPMERICHWTKDLVELAGENPYPNGWIFLKGGNLSSEISATGRNFLKKPVSDFFEEPFFKDKFIIHLQA